uniref:Uncharacterized protein n=1 Tax=Candidatus Kentrum sp. DK TaxID=2126562 RepID=A0A450SBK1_9GAMM|nr:MAG: hypothetical protein BECKDK2373B_GA0170837_102520 [Candidatus Kentron sp. DK]
MNQVLGSYCLGKWFHSMETSAARNKRAMKVSSYSSYRILKNTQ